MFSLVRTKTFFFLSIAVFFWGGCQTIEHEGFAQKDQAFDAALPEPRPLPFQQITSRKAEMMDETPLAVAADTDAENPSIERKLDMPARVSSKEGESFAASEYPDNLIKGVPDPETELEVGFVFNGDSIDVVTKTFASENMLNFSYLVDPAVKGAITMEIKTKMTARETWATFEHILWLAGAYASKNPGFIHILPFDKMPKERRIFADHEIQPNVIVDFLYVRYKKSADIANLIKPFMTDGATVTDLVDSNTLIVVEAPANINKIRELVKRLDNKGERAWPVKCFPCKEVDAEELAAELQLLLPVVGLPVATGTGTSGGAIKVTALPRIGIIIVSAALEEVVDEVGNWIKSLDRSDLLDREEIYFYNVRHSTVEKLSASLDAFFNTVTSSSPTTASTTKSTSAKASATTGSDLSTGSTSQRNTSQTRSTSSNRRTSQDKQSGEKNSLTTTVFDTEVIVYTDDESNRITLKTTPRTWNLIKLFLERQDVPPRQVAIQAIITEIKLDKSNEFGISYSLERALLNGTLAAGSFGADTVLKSTAPGSLIGGSGEAGGDTLNALTSTGLGLLFNNKAGDTLAFLKAYAGEGNTRVLSEPQLVVLSGSSGSMQAGESVPIASESTTYSDSSNNFRTNYEYKDVGVIMTVTPYITAGHDVRMVIEQEVSSVSRNADTTNPTISKKTVSSELVVADNTTLLMGGMIQNTSTTGRYGIPFLMDIPYIGFIFGYNTTSNVRTELLILLTVNVLDTKNPQEELIRRYKASLEEIAKSRDTELF
jgi:general secretion pathway protein D